MATYSDFEDKCTCGSEDLIQGCPVESEDGEYVTKEVECKSCDKIFKVYSSVSWRIQV